MSVGDFRHDRSLDGSNSGVNRESLLRGCSVPTGVRSTLGGMVDSPDLASALKELRSRAGLTQEAAAEKVGGSDRTISDYERGAAIPSWGKLLALLKVYGANFFDLAHLLEGNEEITYEAVRDGKPHETSFLKLTPQPIPKTTPEDSAAWAAIMERMEEHREINRQLLEYLRKKDPFE